MRTYVSLSEMPPLVILCSALSRAFLARRVALHAAGVHLSRRRRLRYRHGLARCAERPLVAFSARAPQRTTIAGSPRAAPSAAAFALGAPAAQGRRRLLIHGDFGRRPALAERGDAARPRRSCCGRCELSAHRPVVRRTARTYSQLAPTLAAEAAFAAVVPIMASDDRRRLLRRVFLPLWHHPCIGARYAGRALVCWLLPARHARLLRLRL